MKDGGWIFNGRAFQANEKMVDNGKFIEEMIPRKIKGNFFCDGLGLTSLEGGPIEVSGDYDCGDNKLTSLEGVSVSVGGYFDCSNNNIKTLYGIPKMNNHVIFAHSNHNNLRYEAVYIQTNKVSGDYWTGLLDHIIKNKIELTKIKTWPNRFLSKNLIESSKILNKFNL